MFISPLLIKFIKKPEDLLTYKLSLKMGLINQQGMYQGAAPLNPLPYVNIALQQRARKQAREDAIDKYYTDLPNKINDKGVRDQEIPVINSLKTQMSDYYVKNKAAINNPNLDNGAARHGLDLLFRKTDATAAESKNRLKTDLQLGKWRFNKEKEYIFKNPNFIKIHEAHTLPIGTEGSQSIDIASLDVPPKPLDLNSVRKDLKQFKYSEGTPTVTEHPTDKTLEVVTSNPIFKDEDKKSLYDYGATRLHSDPSFEEFIKNGLPNTGLLPNLVEIAKKQFGVKDATEISDEDLAAAFLYSQLPTSQTKAKVIPSFTNREAAKMDDWKTKEKARALEWDRRTGVQQKNSLIRIAANRQGQEIANGTSGNSFDEFGGVTPIYIEIPNEGGFGSVTGKIDKGVVFDKDGNLFTGEVEVGKKDIPVNVATSLAAGKIPIPAKVPLVVKDGIIVGIKTPNGIVDREKGILNLQKKANTEPIKGDQPKFGKTTKEVEQPAPKKETPKSNKKQVPGWNN